MIMDRAALSAMIPHAGAMCLLDGVLGWDAGSIHCVSRRFRDQDNPLRRPDGRLGAVCGVEIAAQAMALHGRLAAGADGAPAQGYLASLRDVRFGGEALDAGIGDLTVIAERLMGDDRGASYRFMLSCGGVARLSGRATVLLAVAA